MRTRHIFVIAVITTSLLGAMTAAAQTPPEMAGVPGFMELDEEFAATSTPTLARGAQAAPPISAVWVGEPQWLSGVGFSGGEAFSNSVAKGINFFSSSVGDGEYVPVEIRFMANPAEHTLCQTFLRPGYNSKGVGTFPGSAWDISDPDNPRRLNICFVEWDDGGGANPPPDNLWNPSDDGSLAGGREYLFIMNSDYDGTGMTYAGINISSGSPDVLYAMWPKLQSGAALHDSDPASLFIKPHYLPLTMSNFYALLPTDTELDLRWVYTGPPTDVIRLYSGVSYPPETMLAEFDPTTESYLHTGLTPGQTRYYYLGAYDTAIIADCCVVPGDADHDGSLNIADVSFVIGFIFSGGAAPPCEAEADADGSGSVNIADVSYVIAFIFSGGPAPAACPGSDTTFTLIGESLDLSVVPQSVSSGVSLVGAWNQRGTYGDCWGYEADGVEYALICARNEGVSIIDIDATPPTEVGFIPSIAPGMDAKDVKIYQNYAIVIKEYEPIQIVDLTDVTNPSQVSTIQPVGSSGAHNCMVDGDYLYVVGNHSLGGLEIFDISTPAAPFLAGSFQQFYYHDIDIRNDTLYAAGIYGNGVDILDISSKGAPVRIDQFNYSGSGAHNCELLGSTDFVAIGDEIGSSGNHVRIFDVTDPTNATLASQIIVDPQAVTHNCYELDGLLYIAYYTEGLRVWDVNDPNNPFEVGYFDTFTGSGYGYRGAWNTYPYYTSGRIIVSDMQTGLYVLELSP